VFFRRSRVLRLVRGSWAEVWGRGLGSGSGVGLPRRASGADRIWAGQTAAAGVSPEAEPFSFAVPGFGQVQGEVAAADGRGPELSRTEGWPGRRRRGPGCGPWRRSPARRRWRRTFEQVGERAVVSVGEDLLFDRVAAVPAFGLDQFERRIGQHGVAAVGREQLALAGGGLGVQVADPADDQPGGDGPVRIVRERGAGGFGDLRVRDPGRQLVVSDRAHGPAGGSGEA
jgi:hypothetical protein